MGERGRLSRRRRFDEVSTLRGELERLHEENARLRLDAQRPLHLLTVAEKVRACVPSPEAGAEAADEARQLLVDTMVLKTAMLAVLRDLQTAAAQLERRLELDAPNSEIDRRVRDREHIPQQQRGGWTGEVVTLDVRSAVQAAESSE